MVGVRKRIDGAHGVTTLGPLRFPFDVEGRVAAIPVPAGARGRAGARRRRLPGPRAAGGPAAGPLSARARECYNAWVSKRARGRCLRHRLLADRDGSVRSGRPPSSSSARSPPRATAPTRSPSRARPGRRGSTAPSPRAIPPRAATSTRSRSPAGPGSNAIDLTGLTAAAFPAVEYVSVLGEEGNDTVAGSPLGDELEGDDGDDTLRGAAGDDLLDGDDGSDTPARRRRGRQARGRERQRPARRPGRLGHVPARPVRGRLDSARCRHRSGGRRHDRAVRLRGRHRRGRAGSSTWIPS